MRTAIAIIAAAATLAHAPALAGQHDQMVRVESKVRVDARVDRQVQVARQRARPDRGDSREEQTETISRTLLLAQRTADATLAEARSEADRVLAAARADLALVSVWSPTFLTLLLDCLPGCGLRRGRGHPCHGRCSDWERFARIPGPVTSMAASATPETTIRRDDMAASFESRTMRWKRCARRAKGAPARTPGAVRAARQSVSFRAETSSGASSG